MMAYKPFELNSGYFSETMRICHNLKYLKEQTKLSYRKLCKVLGFKDKTILNYVYGYTRPNPERLQIIAEYFGIESIEDFCLDETTFAKKYPIKD